MDPTARSKVPISATMILRKSTRSNNSLPAIVPTTGTFFVALLLLALALTALVLLL
jgi:hypothetical protein